MCSKFVYFWCFVGSVGGGLFSPRLIQGQQDNLCSLLGRGDKCVTITRCKFFTDLLDKTPIPRPRSIVKIIKDHQCGFEDNLPKVCCSFTYFPPLASITTLSTTPTTTTTTQTITYSEKTLSKVPMPFDDIYNHPNFGLLPVDTCGRISFNSRITSGNKANLEEFPWMALIVYNTPDSGIEFRCGGTVISEKYVLTAGHCILDTIIGVRLGEYDLKNSDKDCEGSYCSPPAQDFYVEGKVIHGKYNSKTLENDIALIRLSTSANFSFSNVQPICLPISELNDDLTGKSAIVSGWGVTEEGSKSNVLLKTTVPVVPLSVCKKLYRRFSPVTQNQICAGGYQGRDSCAGDSGGPLMYAGLVNGSPRFIQHGVVSFGPRECGTEGQPGIYTRVGSFLTWILDNIRP